MGGSRIKIASKVLSLFLQSLPANSYYQIIGFGYTPKKYDEIPKENNKKNIEESLKIIETLKAEEGGMEIYSPLEEIYTSKCYDEISLPKNIFLLTDGEMHYKKETLNLIEENSNKFSVYSFGIGKYFDEDFIKKAGIVGKGNYSFCKNINQLNQIITSNINDICVSNIKNFKIISSFEENNLYKLIKTPIVIKENDIIKLDYINNFSEEENKKKFNFTVKYNKNQQEFTNNLELECIDLPEGNELSKLIMYQYILKNEDKLSLDEKIKIALKYQFLIEGTSLFPEIELSEKTTSPIVYKFSYFEKENKRKLLDHQLNKGYSQLNNLDKIIKNLQKEAKIKVFNAITFSFSFKSNFMIFSLFSFFFFFIIF